MNARETASDGTATYIALAASAERSLFVLEHQHRDLHLRRMGGEILSVRDATSLASAPVRIAAQRDAVAELKRRAADKPPTATTGARGVRRLSVPS